MPPVSLSAQKCQEEQEQGWSKVQQSISDAKGSINMVKSNVQTWKDNLKTLTTGALVDLHWVNCGAEELGEGTAKVWLSQSTGFGGVMDVTFESLARYLNAAGNSKCMGSVALQVRQGGDFQ